MFAVQVMTAQARKADLRCFCPEKRGYAVAFDRFYQAGAAGNSFDYTASSPWAMYIDRTTAQQAFAHGRDAMRAQQARDVQRAQSRTVKEAEGGVYYSEDFSAEKVSLDGKQKANLSLLKEMANERKIRVSVVRTIDGGQTNAYYDPHADTVVVALDAAEGAYTFWAIHEVTHRLREQNPAAYAKIRDFVLGVMENQKGFNLDSRIKHLQDVYQRQKGQELSRADAIEEIVANSTPVAMLDESAVREFAQKNKGLVETIRTWLEDFIKTLKDAINRIAGRLPEVKAIREDIQTLTKIRDAMNAALDETGGIRESAGGEARYSENESNEDYKKPITPQDIAELRNFKNWHIGQFKTDDLQKAQKWAYKFYQEMHEKSPFFRAWFGDWRANDITPVVRTSFKTARFASAEEGAKAIRTGLKDKTLMRGNVENDDTKIIINIGAQVYNDTLTYANRELSRDHDIDKYSTRISLLNNIEKICERAILLDTEIADDNTASDRSFFHSFYTIAQSGDKLFLVKLLVDEFNSQNGDIRRAYNLSDIKISPVAVSQVYKPADTTSESGNQISTFTIAQLYGIVKQYDKNFFAGKAVDPHMLNEDGTPKVVYHATDEDFTVFDREKLGRVTDGNANYVDRAATAHVGFWFNDADISQQTFQNGAMGVFLNIRKPYVVGSISDLATEIIDRSGEDYNELQDRFDDRDYSVARELGESFREYLEQNGYDGIIVEDEEFGGTSYVVFNSERAKSATDNIGTFDGTNPDIRYSINEQDLENTGVQFDKETESAAPVKYSLNEWTKSEYVQNREKAARILADNLHVSYEQAEKYIDDINSVAYLIAADRIRLDYEANDTFTVIKPDSEYKFTVDASTLCAKRRTFTGTMDAIQRALPNAVLTAEDRVKIRDMMMKKGYEVACGICYVESSRKDSGPKAQRFIDAYTESQRTGESIKYESTSGKVHEVRVDNAPAYASDYVPTQYDLNTTEGIDALQKNHPDVYKAYVAYMNRMGQSKPKLLETRTEYRGEIMKFRQSLVDYLNDHGGLRLQSYSDFETPHLIDMMQVVMDMSRMGLKSQAYTKIPNFARVFGSTGVKINLSLIAKGTGLDENGNLVFDDVEGMSHEEAFAIRERFSRDVGTILVGKNDAHIIAAMADPRIDFIIPFHKSQWNQSLYEALGLTGYSDYTDFQNEKAIDGSKIKNYDPMEYWDFSKIGDENAQIYLEKCRQEGRIPKFPQFSHYPGYWKLLIDFKMYDNNGIGAPQQVVRPEFQMDEAARILREYEGGANSFPVAQDVVDQFLKEYNPNSVRRFAEITRNFKFSINELDQLREDLKSSRLREDNLSTTVRTQENIIAGLKEEFELTKGHKLKPEAVEKLAKRLTKQYSSSYNVHELSENLGKLFDYIANSENLDWDSVMEISSTISKRILEESSTLNRDLYDQYADMRDYFRTQKISIPQDMRSEVGEYFGGWNNLRRQLFGRVNLVNNGASLDSHWDEICDLWPEFFDREAVPQEQVTQVINALDAIQPYHENPFGMNMDEAAYDLAQEIYEDYFSVPEVKTFADRQQQKLEQTIAHMTEMRNREKQRIRDRYEQKLSDLRKQKGEQMAALRERYEKAIGQEREMYRERLERLRAQKNEQLMRQQAKLRTEKMEAVQRSLSGARFM